MPIEATIIGFLTTALDTEHVYAERPANPPGTYYVIERTASAEENHIQRATIAVQSITDTSLLNAAKMNEQVLRKMPLIVQENWDISCCRLNSAYNFTDVESKQYRYQAVFDLYYMRGE